MEKKSKSILNVGYFSLSNCQKRVSRPFLRLKNMVTKNTKPFAGNFRSQMYWYGQFFGQKSRKTCCRKLAEKSPTANFFEPILRKMNSLGNFTSRKHSSTMYLPSYAISQKNMFKKFGFFWKSFVLMSKSAKKAPTFSVKSILRNDF